MDSDFVISHVDIWDGHDKETEIYAEIELYIHHSYNRVIIINKASNQLTSEIESIVDKYFPNTSVNLAARSNFAGVEIVCVTLSIAGLYKIIKDYKSLRESVLLIISDIQKISDKIVQNYLLIHKHELSHEELIEISNQIREEERATMNRLRRDFYLLNIDDNLEERESRSVSQSITASDILDAALGYPRKKISPTPNISLGNQEEQRTLDKKWFQEWS